MSSRSRPVFGKGNRQANDESFETLLSQTNTFAESDAMAAVMPEPKQSTESRARLEVPPEIRCPICLDPFQGPVTLRCSHNVCQEHILDLAVEDSAYTGPNAAFHVKCPKCRQKTEFSRGWESVQINHEMGAVVRVMLGMVQQTQSVPETNRASDELRHVETPSRQPKNAGGRRVKFENQNELGEGKGEEADVTSKHVLSAQRQLLMLEKRLEEQRRKLQEEREETIRLKTLQYKRERAEQFSKRDTGLPLEEVPGSTAAVRSQPESGLASSVADAAEAFARKMKAEQERRREAERIRREQEIRQGIEEWKQKANLLVSGEEVRAHFERLNSYLGEVDEDERGGGCSTTSLPSSGGVPPEGISTDVDDEVERALWSVEAKVLRERDEEMSRRRMAEIAEMRARQLLDSYTPKKDKKVTSPTYVPKLNRLQKI